MKRVYVSEPKLLIPASSPDELLLCYAIVEWEQGSVAVSHPPCNQETAVPVAFGDTAVEIKAKIIDNLLATIAGITSNDIIFLGGWV
jgi:hypothetical protein